MQKELPIPDELKSVWQLFATRRVAFPLAKHGVVSIVKMAQQAPMHLLANYNAHENTDIEWFSIQVCRASKAVWLVAIWSGVVGLFLHSVWIGLSIIHLVESHFVGHCRN